MFSFLMNDKVPVKSVSKFESEIMKGIKVLGVYKNNIYARIENVGYNANYVYKSTDSGKTWVAFYQGTSQYNHAVMQFAHNNIVLVWSNNSIRRTIDGGVTWTTVLTLSSANKFTLYHGMDQKMQSSQMAMFAEYGSGSEDFFVWKTIDSGATWNVVYTRTAPSEIRHFHSVKHIPDMNKWIVTWGDDICGWAESTDDGATWTELLDTQNSQVFRTLDLLFLPSGRNKGDYVWATDAGIGSFTGVTPAVYQCPSTNFNDIKRLITLPSLSWAIGGMGNFLICGTYYENKDSLRSVFIYISEDEGKTWETVLKLPVFSIDTVGGYTGIHGPDSNGDFYMVGVNINDLAGATTVKLSLPY